MATLGLSEAEREAVERLERDIIKPSMDRLVLLDFATERSPASKQVSALLDTIAADYAGKGVALVRVDVNSEPLIAAQFRVQALPTVYAFYHGQPVADLSAYQNDAQFRRGVDQLLGQLRISGSDAAQQAEIEPLIAMGEQVLAEGDAQRAVSIFRQIYEMAPDSPEVVGGLARALLAAGEIEEARAFIDSAPAALANHAAIARARAALDIASAPVADTAGFEARLAANPDDHEARLELAGALMAAGDRDGAADALLDLVGRDREWNEGAARKKLLQLIEAQGLEDPWARTQRRRLSALLFT